MTTLANAFLDFCGWLFILSVTGSVLWFVAVERASRRRPARRRYLRGQR